jgi:hypothetical protein
MKILEYSNSDLETLRRYHSEAKFGFEFPDPTEPQVIIRKCLVDDDGVVRMAAFGRLQACAWLLVDGSWKTPAERFEAVEILEFAMCEEARNLRLRVDDSRPFGIDEATAQVTPAFGKRLRLMGWDQSIGQTWHKSLTVKK